MRRLRTVRLTWGLRAESLKRGPRTWTQRRSLRLVKPGISLRTARLARGLRIVSLTRGSRTESLARHSEIVSLARDSRAVLLTRGSLLEVLMRARRRVFLSRRAGIEILSRSATRALGAPGAFLKRRSVYSTAISTSTMVPPSSARTLLHRWHRAAAHVRLTELNEIRHLDSKSTSC